MALRAVFLDFDGTLLNSAGEVLPSSVEAMRRLRENGIMPILASGRADYLLWAVDTSLFDAFLTFNGQYVYLPDGRVLRDVPLHRSVVERAVDQCREGVYSCLFMERDRYYINARDEHVATVERDTHQTYPIADFTQALDNPVYQLNLFVDKSQEAECASDIAHARTTRWHPDFIDVIPEEGGKEFGVRAILDELGIASDEAIAFGDGGNDIGMFDLVGTSVAMGNANDDAKRAATMVTEDADHDGIYNALRSLGAI